MGTPIEGGEVQGTGPDGGDGSSGLNPAWDSVLSALPEEFHKIVTPEFQKWDQAAQQKIEAANAELKQFESFKPFVENGFTAADLDQGVQLLHQINQNPQAVYNALAEAYDLTPAQVEAAMEGEGDDDEEPETFFDPRVDQLQQGVELIAQNLLDQQQQKLNDQAERDLDAELKGLHEKHGDFNEQYVLSLKAVNPDMDLETAVQNYNAMAQSILQQNPRPFAPSVMGNSGGGAGLPSQAIDPRTLDGKGTRDLVAQMLKAANEGN